MGVSSLISGNLNQGMGVPYLDLNFDVMSSALSLIYVSSISRRLYNGIILMCALVHVA